jgi:hypothetical protein
MIEMRQHESPVLNKSGKWDVCGLKIAVHLLIKSAKLREQRHCELV